MARGLTQAARDYQRRYRQDNRDALSRAKRERTQQRKAFIDSHRADGCRVCGFNVAEVCEFHHVDPATKEFDVACMTTLSEARILTEIQKCIVLCPNCHALADHGLIDLGVVSS